MTKLPSGWSTASLEQLAGSTGLATDGDWIESKDQDPDGGIRLVQLADVGVGEFRNLSSRFVTTETAQRLNCTFLESGDLLIARMPDPIGRACIFPGGQPAITAVDVFVWRASSEGVPSAGWLMHFVNSGTIRTKIKEQAGGTTRQRISGGRLKKLTLPVPPLPEQQRIVAKIDSLSAKSRHAHNHLDRVPLLAEKYKQAILAAAFRGDLTQSWRKLNGRVFAYPKTLVSMLADVVTGFTPPTKHRSRYFGGNVAFFKPTDLNAGYQVIEPRETLTEEGASVGRKLPQYSTLVTCIGATIGKTGFARVECCSNQQINGLVPHRDLVVPEWLYWMVISPEFQQSIFDNASATTLPIINKGRFLNLSLPRPSLEEQLEIVRLLEKAFAWVDRLASETTRASRLIDHLGESILAKAFRGELVPQHPNDEPASSMLERIKTQRSAAEPRRGRENRAKF